MLTIPGYKILQTINETSNSCVYRGVRLSDQKTVILKVLQQDYPTPSELSRYRQEYKIIRQLSSPGVIKVYELISHQKSLVMVQEDIGGISLKILLNGSNSLIPKGINLDIFFFLATEITQTLGEIHSANIIHKDLNPSNIIFNPQTQELKIIDFGISSQLNRENLTLKNADVLEGTLAYMSPEQTGRMNHSLDYRTDFYSLGITFYELLTKQLPFPTHDPLELIHCHIAKKPFSPRELNPEIPEIVSDLIMKLIAKNPEDRYQSAIGIKFDLEKCWKQLKNTGKISPFSLASQDCSDRFQIPEKLYGRTQEIQTLLSTFERVTTVGENSPESIREIILITGYSGMGKTSLVKEIYRTIRDKSGHFISGKFEQFQSHTPYLGIINAFREFVGQILTETDENLQKWRELLLSALGTNGQVIIDVIPEVELIIGVQPPLTELKTSESQHRFHTVFKNFLRVLCSPENPLVLFLDDLQWADLASLKLLQLIITETPLQSFLLIGAYRDNEMTPHHPLITTLTDLEKNHIKLNKIILNSLEIESIIELISAVLHQSLEQIIPLAFLILRKTGGNPYFIREFLKTLYSENLLTFDVKNLCWQWDLHKIESMGITENVVDLMINRLKKLPLHTQKLLELAACIGSKFDLKTLSIVGQMSPENLFNELIPAIHSELILPISELDERLLIEQYKFGHDRVQQAAYSLIEREEKKGVHLRIGRLLQENLATDSGTKFIFTILEHLNEGCELMTSSSEILDLIKLNLKGGQKAKKSHAYLPAGSYFRQGLSLLSHLSNEIWLEYYPLAFELYKELAEIEYLKGNHPQTKRLIDLLLEKAKSLSEKVEIFSLLKNLYATQGKDYHEGLPVAFKLFQELELTFPMDSLEQEEVIGKKLKEIKTRMVNRKIFDLRKLPLMSDEMTKVKMKLCMDFWEIAFYNGLPNLMLLSALNLVTLSLEYGNTQESSFGYVLYGIYLALQKQDYNHAYQFGQLALHLIEEFADISMLPKARNLFCNYINYHKNPWRQNVILYEENVQKSIETGEIVFGVWAAVFVIWSQFLSGFNLDEIAKTSKKYLKFVQKTNDQKMLQVFYLLRLVINNLQGKAPDYSILKDEQWDALEFVQSWNEYNFINGSTWYAILQGQILYTYEDYEKALEVMDNYAQELSPNLIMFPVSQYYFYYPLILTALYQKKSPSQQKNFRKILKESSQKLKKWAEYCPENFLHQSLLLQAEIAKISGESWEKITSLYTQAIDSAHQYQLIHIEALAQELAAKFWLSKNQIDFAKIYLKKAHYCYQLWGANSKVKDLENKYYDLLNSHTPSSINPDLTEEKIPLKDTPTNSLDLVSVIKAFQTISEEIELEKLLDKLMKILIENAGAQIGYLILPETEPRTNRVKWLIEAGGSIDVQTVSVMQSIPIENKLPISLINYVIRVKQTVVLNQAYLEGNFIHDPYLIQNRPLSILCTPLMNQGQLIGILYLENNLIQGAFNLERLAILKLLSSQAAISLQNAKLYGDLNTSQQELYQLLETVPVGVSLHQLTGEMTYINKTGKQLLGQENYLDISFDSLSSFSQFYQTGTGQLYPLENLPAIRALQGESIYVDDIEMRQGEQILLLESHAVPVFDSKGNIIYALNVFQDITERKKIQNFLADYNHTLEIQVQEKTEALKESEARFREAFNTAAIGMCLLSLEHDFLQVNPAFCELLGYSESELLSLNLAQIVYPQDLKLGLQMKQKLLTGEINCYHLEKRYLHQKSQIIWTLSSVSLVRDFHQNPLYFIEQIQDISQRKWAESELKKSAARFRAIFNQTFEFVELLTPQGIVLEANQTALDFAGITREEIINKPFWETPWWTISQSTQKQLKEAIDRAAQGELVHYEVEILGKNHQIITINFSLRPICDEEGNITFLISEGQDITAHKQAQIALEKAKLAAESANHAKSAFLANMSHELRTPLNAILGFSQLMLRSPHLSSQNQNYLHIINNSGSHLLTLINDILDLAKIEAGRMTINETSFNFRNLLYDLDNLFRLQAVQKGLNFNFVSRTPLPEFIKTDEIKLRQVLINLISNAIKFTKQGEVLVKISAENYDDSSSDFCNIDPTKNKLYFEISDTGYGISPEELEMIFEPFEQSQTGRKSQQGTGLGLAISRTFIQLMGGELQVKSEVGKGTTFKFTMKITSISNWEENIGSESTKLFLAPNQPRYRILLVDDQWDNRQLLLHLLEPLGFDLKEASHGLEAIEIWEKWHPHVIIMDMRMPVMDGYEATKRIKSTIQGKGTVIIALTASGLEENRTQSLSVGCDDFIRKPFAERELFDKINRHLDVQFIIKERPQSSNLTSEVLTITPEEISGLSLPFLHALEKATLDGDLESMFDLINEISPEYESLRNKLNTLAKKYQFKTITNLIQKRLSLEKSSQQVAL